MGEGEETVHCTVDCNTQESKIYTSATFNAVFRYNLKILETYFSVKPQSQELGAHYEERQDAEDHLNS